MKSISKNLVWAVLGIVLLGVISLWASSSFDGLFSGPAGALVSLGQLAGLLAAAGALTQFMLMGRIGWIERPFGLEKIAVFHRLNGYATISLILIHPLLLAFGYGLNAGVSALAQYLTFITQFPDVWKALIAQLLFLAVVGTSIYIVRRKLNFEHWYWVHLMVYAAIILAFAHQISNGSTFTSSALSKNLWIGLYGFVAVNVLYYRFLTLGINYLKYRFKVDEVVAETGDTASIYISGRRLHRWKSEAGQFVLVRFLVRGLWLEEHPFSLSMVPKDGRLRITVKNVGDYTARLQNLKPGAAVLVAGPYGSFLASASHKPDRLYIAGGVGITPIRSLIEAGDPAGSAVLLYANKTLAGTIFAAELGQLLAPAQLHYFGRRDERAAGETGRIDIAAVERLVPDYREREIYICGPAAMISSIVAELEKVGFPLDQVHYERFSFHRQT
ncbi:MAG: ferredoxin reductase family protein [Candidatus Saccharimonadales bacterium]